MVRGLRISTESPELLTQQAGLDDYSTIRCVNYIRSEVLAQRDPRLALAASVASGGAASPKPWDGDQYMKPVLPDDPLLFHEYDDAQNTCGINIAMLCKILLKYWLSFGVSQYLIVQLTAIRQGVGIDPRQGSEFSLQTCIPGRMRARIHILQGPGAVPGVHEGVGYGYRFW